jgi:gamma-glutamylcyclotransferase
MIHYFAYGSNLHPLRLTERVASADLITMAEYSGHLLCFNKRSEDGSSKCNMQKTDFETDRVHGAIYKLSAEQKPVLDRFEGVGKGYQDHQITLKHHGKEYHCFTYLAQPSHTVDNLKPYHWYKQLVLLGAQYLDFPENYLSAIEAVDSMDDSDLKRRQTMQNLIERINNYH